MSYVTKSLHFLLPLFVIFGATQAMARAPKTLIVSKGGEMKPGLAKSWEKVSAGKYKFELDTSHKLKGDKDLTPEIVKASLESKLASKYGLKATPEGTTAVMVEFKADADENEVLKKIARTRIRAKSVQLALETSVSEGGIRAKTADRAPVAGEVKATVLKVKGSTITVRVTASEAKAMKAGKKYKVTKPDDFETAKKEIIFFMPSKKGKSKVWLIKAGSMKKE